MLHIKYEGSFAEMTGLLEGFIKSGIVPEHAAMCIEIRCIPTPVDESFNREVLRIATEQGKIPAIKYVREIKNNSLKDAKDYVEALQAASKS